MVFVAYCLYWNKLEDVFQIYYCGFGQYACGFAASKFFANIYQLISKGISASS